MNAARQPISEDVNRRKGNTAVSDILIVDDEERLRKALKRSLASDSCRTLTAASGDEALWHVKKKDIDLVITDMVMPGMDGMTLIRNIKGSFPDMKVIIITAYGSPESMQEAEQLGVDCYLSKPFDLSRLKAIVSDLLMSKSGDTILNSHTNEGIKVMSPRAYPGVEKLWFTGGKTAGAVTGVSKKILHCVMPGSITFALGKVTGVLSGLTSIFHRR